MKNAILLFLLLNIVPSIKAQNIVGRVIDEKTSMPIEYANVLIINRVDSSFVAGVVTDDRGLFSIPSNTTNDKLIKVSYIGYTDYIIPLDRYELKDIKLQIDNTLLDEVNIVGSVQKLENSGISTNIQATYLKNMGTAIDVLGQLPFVHKSGNKIEIFGKGEPLIYINSGLLRDNSQLEELSSEDIKKVTVITNPGAEYDGKVNAVIRIETIKAVGDGISGNTSLNTHFDRKFSHGELLNLNYRKNNWDIFGMLRFAESRNLSYQETNQSVPNRGIITDVEQQVKESSYYKSLKGNIGLNSTIGEHSSYGIRYEYTHTPRTRNSVDADAILLNDKVKSEEFLSFSNSNTKVENNYINLYYLGKISPWLSGQFDSDIYWGETKRFQNVQNQRFNIEELISTNSKQEYKLFAGKLTLKSPLLGGQLIYGGEYAYTKNTQLFYANEEAIEQGIENNKNKAKQDSYATFVIYNRSWKSLSLEVGMRYENVNFDYYNQHGKLKAESKRYENILPNFSLSYNSDLFQTILSYRSTVNRPSYYQLRNDIQYDGPYTYESGNTQLKPIDNKSISLLALWKGFKMSTMYTIRKKQHPFYT